MNESMNGNRNTFAMLNDVVHAMVENDKTGSDYSIIVAISKENGEFARTVRVVPYAIKRFDLTCDEDI
jgi:hypothetical protein